MVFNDRATFYEQVTGVKLGPCFSFIRIFAFVVADCVALHCCSPPSFYTHSDELVGRELGAGWGSREESMLLFISRPWKTKSLSQSSGTRCRRNGGTWRSLGSLFVERHVWLLRGPETMEQDGQLTSHCNYGFVSGLLAASRGQAKAPLSES